MVAVSSQDGQGTDEVPDTRSLNQSDPVAGQLDAEVPIFSAEEFEGESKQVIAEHVRDACHQFGFFYVDLDRGQQSAVNNVLHEMGRFFAIPDDDPEKQRIRQGIDQTGWVPKFTEPAYQPGTVSSLEAFDCDRDDIDGHAQRNIWPALPGFREVVAECWSNYVGLADGILDVLGRAAGIAPEFLVNQCDSRELNTMRLLHYAADAPQQGDSNVGIAAHTDFECITLIYQDAPGLELTDPSGKWFDAPIAGGRIVVLLGDMLERWTNGYFKATGHRVRETEEQRFSIVVFIAANDGLQVAPLPRFVSESSPALYDPITQAQHIDNELRRSRENAGEAGTSNIETASI